MKSNILWPHGNSTSTLAFTVSPVCVCFFLVFSVFHSHSSRTWLTRFPGAMRPAQTLSSPRARPEFSNSILGEKNIRCPRWRKEKKERELFHSNVTKDKVRKCYLQCGRGGRARKKETHFWSVLNDADDPDKVESAVVLRDGKVARGYWLVASRRVESLVTRLEVLDLRDGHRDWYAVDSGDERLSGG